MPDSVLLRIVIVIWCYVDPLLHFFWRNRKHILQWIAYVVASLANGFVVKAVTISHCWCSAYGFAGLGTTSVSVIAILCALLGSIIGFLVRHFYPVNVSILLLQFLIQRRWIHAQIKTVQSETYRQEVSINHFFSRIQKQFLRTQRKATLISFCDIKSAVASSMGYTLLLRLIRLGRGYLAMVFPSVRLQKEVPLRPSRRRPELRKTSTAPNIGLNNKAPLPPGQLGDLISFAGDAGDKEGSGNANSQEGKVPSYEGDLMGLLYIPPGSVKKIDHMIETNLSGFSSRVNRRRLTVSGCSVSRRVHGDK